MNAQILRFPSGRLLDLRKLAPECAGTTLAGACPCCGSSLALLEPLHAGCAATLETRVPQPGAYTACISRPDGRELWRRFASVEELLSDWQALALSKPGVALMVQVFAPTRELVFRQCTRWWPDAALVPCCQDGCEECADRVRR